MRDQGSTEFPEIAGLVWERVKPHLSVQRVVIAVYLLIIWIAYIFFSEPMAAITVFPSWAWCALALFMTVSYPLKKWGANLVFVAICMLPVLATTSEEFWAPVRGIQHPPTSAQKPYIVTLNCAGGMIEAAKEAIDTGADQIYLQESPSEKELQEICNPAGYDVYWGVDGSVLLKRDALLSGEEVQEVVKEQNFTLVRTDIRMFVSLRLQPPIFRLDLYSPECWKSQAEGLRSRKQEMREIIDPVRGEEKKFGPDTHYQIVVAGDFNAIPSQLPATFGTDVGGKYGVGWIGTAVNDYPLARIDRIWFAGDMPEQCRLTVKKTVNSDHRMNVLSCGGL